MTHLISAQALTGLAAREDVADVDGLLRAVAWAVWLGVLAQAEQPSEPGRLPPLPGQLV